MNRFSTLACLTPPSWSEFGSQLNFWVAQAVAPQGVNSDVATKGGFDWVQVVIYTGITLAIAVVGVYLVMLVKDWMQSPQEYTTTGDDLESLRQALQLGSIDEEEYRRAVQALKTMNDRLAPKEGESLKSDWVQEELSASSFKELPADHHAEGSVSPTGNKDRETN